MGTVARLEMSSGNAERCACSREAVSSVEEDITLDVLCVNPLELPDDIFPTELETTKSGKVISDGVVERETPGTV